MGRRKTGNGTIANQWLYCKVHFPYIWKFKPGITGYLWKRRRQTSADVFGFYIILGAVRMPFAFQIEQFFLSSTKRFRRQVHGKGGVEVRAWYVCVPFLLFIYVMIILKYTWPLPVALWLGYLCRH